MTRSCFNNCCCSYRPLARAAQLGGGQGDCGARSRFRRQQHTQRNRATVCGCCQSTATQTPVNHHHQPFPQYAFSRHVFLFFTNLCFVVCSLESKVNRLRDDNDKLRLVLTSSSRSSNCASPVPASVHSSDQHRALVSQVFFCLVIWNHLLWASLSCLVCVCDCSPDVVRCVAPTAPVSAQASPVTRPTSVLLHPQL